MSSLRKLVEFSGTCLRGKLNFKNSLRKFQATHGPVRFAARELRGVVVLVYKERSK